MKRTKLQMILVSVLLVFTLGCKKNNLCSINDLHIHVNLLDENHNSTRAFNHGEDLIFQYVVNNTLEKIIYYTAYCPLFQFKVFDNCDSLIGDAISSNWACEGKLELLEIAPEASKSLFINWLTIHLR